MSFIGKVGAAVAAVGLAAGSVLGAGSADAAGDLWGAYAFSGQQWESWSAVDWLSAEEAAASVRDRCGGGADCQVMTWANGCGALVWSDQGWVTGASGRTRSEAIRKAIDNMSEHVPVARLANFGSSELSGTEVVDVLCTANAR